MNTIVQLSKYGFRLDSLKNDWQGVDKTCLNSEGFKSLKTGDRIDCIERSKSSFITFFKILPVYDIEIPKITFVSPRQRDILKKQCLNLSFTCLFKDEVNFRFAANREEAIALAHDLYTELKEEYFKW